MSEFLEPGQYPRNREIESRSITQLMCSEPRFKDFGEIWLSHLMRSDWADRSSVKEYLEAGTIMVPVHIAAYEINKGKIDKKAILNHLRNL